MCSRWHLRIVFSCAVESFMRLQLNVVFIIALNTIISFIFYKFIYDDKRQQILVSLTNQAAEWNFIRQSPHQRLRLRHKINFPIVECIFSSSIFKH